MYADKISFLNYCSIYSAIGTKNVRFKEHPCFSEVLNLELIREEHYEIYLIRDKHFCLNTHANNLCLLSDKELKKHLSLARRLFRFFYKVESVKYMGYDAFKVIIDITANHFCHRYLLAWIRYAYEFPYNLILQDALRVKKYYLPKVSVTNLFVLCANSYYDGPTFYGNGHSISTHYCDFLKEKELKDKLRISTVNHDGRLNSIYPERTIRGVSIKSPNARYLSYWNNPKDFESRAEIYLQNYKLLSKQK